jgi:hypothetical protein
MYIDQSILLVDSADEALEIEKKKHNREIADLFLDFLDRDEKHEVKNGVLANVSNNIGMKMR